LAQGPAHSRKALVTETHCEITSVVTHGLQMASLSTRFLLIFGGVGALALDDAPVCTDANTTGCTSPKKGRQLLQTRGEHRFSGLTSPTEASDEACIDVKPSWMTSDCPRDDTLCAKCTSPGWIKNKICAASCYAAGCGYVGDDCGDTFCLDVSPQETAWDDCYDITPTNCKDFCYKEDWINNQYCKLSCWESGCGYDGLDCKLPPPSPPRGDYSLFVQESPKTKLQYASYGKKPWQSGALYVPECTPPSGGWPGVLHIPGRANTGNRIGDFHCLMLSGRGFACHSLDIGDRDNDIKTAVNWMTGAGAKTYNLNPDRISLMGYSAGATAVLSYGLYQSPKFQDKVYSIVSVGGTSAGHVGSDTKTAPPILVLHCADDGIKPFPFVVVPFLQERNKIETDKTSGLLWRVGKHQPFLHTDFYHEIAKFLADAAAYESPTTSWFHDFDYPGQWKSQTHEGDGASLSCFQNNDGIVPIAKGNLWGYQDLKAHESCKSWCMQIAGCVHTIILEARTDDRQQNNCFLYDQVCNTPMADQKGTSSTLLNPYTGPYVPDYCSDK